MRINIKKWIWSLVLLIAVVITSVWLYRLSSATTSNAPVLSHYPDAFMSNITVIQYDQNGQIAMHVVSPYAQHFPTEVVNFVDPKITIVNQKGSPWVIVSEYGQAQQQTKMLYLWDQVVIDRTATPDNQAMTIYTPAVAYNTSTKVASSDQELKLIQPPDNEINAVGFNAYLDKNYVELLGNVQGYYASSHSGNSPLAH